MQVSQASKSFGKASGHHSNVSSERVEEAEINVKMLLRLLGMALIPFVALACFAESVVGSTTSGPSQCRAEISGKTVYQAPVDWDAPQKVREVVEIMNYTVRKAHRVELEACDRDAREDRITCGALKCGGLFSLASESSDERQARQAQIWRAEAAKRSRERLESFREAERLKEQRRQEFIAHEAAAAAAKLKAEKIEEERERRRNFGYE
jgi:hypothetical protein